MTPMVDLAYEAALWENELFILDTRLETGTSYRRDYVYDKLVLAQRMVPDQEVKS